MKTLWLHRIVTCFCVAYASLDLTILHTNDLHARYSEINEDYETCVSKDNATSEGCVGGFARLAYKIQEFRNKSGEENGPEVVYLDAGNSFSGSKLFAVHKAKIASEFMNSLKPDAMALGTHELFYGTGQLKMFLSSTQSPVLSSNVNFKNASASLNVMKSVVLERKGHKIGIIGYTSVLSNPRDAVPTDEIAAIKAETERLDKQGVNVLIALGDSGYQIDKKIAYYVPLIDVVVGGHSHTFLYTGSAPSRERQVDNYPKVIIQPSGKKVPVVQAFAYGKYLGCLNVTFDDDGDLTAYSGRPLLLASKVDGDAYAYMVPMLEALVTPQDQTVLDLLRKFEDAVDDGEAVGRSRVVLDAYGDACVRRECNFGNLVADAMVSYFASQGELLAELEQNVIVGMINGKAIANSIDVEGTDGTITKTDILYSLPYPNFIAACSIKGSDLLKTLERNLEFGKAKCRGEFLQFSGLHVVYNLYGYYGERVRSAVIHNDRNKSSDFFPIKPNDVYKIVSTDYLIDNNCNLIADCYNKKYLNVTYGDAVIWYLSKHSPIQIGLENRIVLLNRS